MIYRRYSSNKGIEIRKKAKELCIAPTGQLTGLEPRTVYVSWQRELMTNIGRPEGMHFLRDIPVLSEEI